MISTGWYYDNDGHLIEVDGSTFDHYFIQRERWRGPWSSEEAAVHVWEFRKSEMVR